MNLQTSVIYEYCEDCKTRFLVHQGGSRSGKTYNILIWLIIQCIKENGWRNKTITICRKTFPALKGTVYRDFIEILSSEDIGIELYKESDHNKTDHHYRLNSNLFEFIAIDQPQKIRGRKRDVVFINEGNELDYEDFLQLNMRTREQVIIDFNPSEEFHWIYEKLVENESRKDEVTFHRSTYRDNPFLTKMEIRQIEALAETDEWHWKVFGMGERAALRDLIFTNWHIVDRVPDMATPKGFGLDFGFTLDPTAIVQVWQMDGDIYVDEKLYEQGMTNQEVGKFLLSLQYRGVVVADSAEPKSIEEIRRMGISIIGAEKGQDSVRKSIDTLKQYKIFVTRRSTNLIKELRMYKWKRDRNDNIIGKGEPSSVMDHAVDALRYWGLDSLKNKNRGQYKFG